eukprot:4845184-Pyramimonas_sp.AAC.1
MMRHLLIVRTRWFDGTSAVKVENTRNRVLGDAACSCGVGEADVITSKNAFLHSLLGGVQQCAAGRTREYNVLFYGLIRGQYQVKKPGNSAFILDDHPQLLRLNGTQGSTALQSRLLHRCSNLNAELLRSRNVQI